MNWFITLFCLTTATCVPFKTELDIYWEKYKFEFNKRYSNKEESARRLIWEQNLNMINKHNLEADLGIHSYWLQVNHLSDMNHVELNCKLNTSAFDKPDGFSSTFIPPCNIDVPDSIDWRKKGYVTEVKNQGECGSCWAFSATGSLEGQMKRKTGTLTSLSEQNLVDCSTAEGNDGCSGGLMTLAFVYVMRNHGLDTEESYPYLGINEPCHFKNSTIGNPWLYQIIFYNVICLIHLHFLQNEPCHFKNSTIGAKCTHYIKISSGNEDDLKKAVATVGPISVGIHANDKFMNYKSGIYDDPHCKAKQFNHGVLVVGYGSKNGDDYWIVKNSWGTDWGMDGYILMARNKHDQCGIAAFASYPIV
uniref:Cathepsin L-like cysteine peptidase 5 protein n=1 Tax=Tityus serrulatus TaxID=6887 RepID=U6JT97_TITSE|nr:cathepsin L-like cysteine peptidase 5 protein [Tityus serrulatus]